MLTPPRTDRRFIPGRTGHSTPLGELEQAVMEAVWEGSGASSVSEAHEALRGEKRVAYNTVKTTMERLADKGILSRAKEGKAYLYTPAVTRAELERRIVATALDRLVEQFPVAIASFFAQPDPQMTDEKRALLLEAIERRREEREGRDG